ncbi:MAG TPA: S8 family serine peptidase, partial [Vicinamibacterales bacterium]|nr:S8 family serine peptidase [Vicinamibacterales bacterium]
MSRLEFRTWLVIAALVIAQSPAIVAVKGGPSPKRARVDRQIEQIEAAGGGGTVSVIIRPDGSTDWASLLKALKSKGIKVGRQARRSNAISLQISRSDLSWLASLPGVASISVDARVYTAPLAAQDILTGTDLTKAVKRASDLRSQLGLTDADPTGNGLGIAIIDSGIAPVPDLASRITAFYDFTNGQNAVASAPLDGYGHGTHVAGLAAGDGTLSNGQFAGVAPDAHLIGLRVLDNSGGGSTSDVIAAVEFATVNKAALGIDVINMSLGHPPFETAATDPMVQAVEAASRAGIIVVVSSGNAGINPSTGLVGYGGVLAPGNAPSAFTIASAKTQGTVDP